MKKRTRIYFMLMLLIFLTSCGQSLASKNEEKQGKLDTQVIVEEEKEVALPDIREIQLVAMGDIMFHNPQLKAAYDPKNGSYRFDEMFSAVSEIVGNADLAIANLETVTAGKEKKYTGYPTFNTPETALDAIKGMGIDILATANNHCLDRGKQGVERTLDEIQKRGIESTGTFKENEKTYLIKEVEGIRLGILSYTYGCNGMEGTLTQDQLSKMVNIIDKEKIKADLAYLDKEKVDFSVVIIHWGVEYQRTPNEMQKELANEMFDWGADIILGSHPHVVQNSEVVQKNGDSKFIIYSMGNFISNQRQETIKNSTGQYTEDGVIVKLVLEKDMNTNLAKIKTVDYQPTWVNRYRDKGKMQYMVLPLSEEIIGQHKSIKERLIKSYNRTMEKMMVWDIE